MGQGRVRDWKSRLDFLPNQFFRQKVRDFRQIASLPWALPSLSVKCGGYTRYCLTTWPSVRWDHCLPFQNLQICRRAPPGHSRVAGEGAAWGSAGHPCIMITQEDCRWSLDGGGESVFYRMSPDFVGHHLATRSRSEACKLFQ